MHFHKGNLLLLLMAILQSARSLATEPQLAPNTPYRQVSEFDDAGEALGYYVERYERERVVLPMQELVLRFGADTIIHQLSELRVPKEDRDRRAILRAMIVTISTTEDSGLRQRVVEHVLAGALSDPEKQGDLDLLPSVIDLDDFSETSKGMLADAFSALDTEAPRSRYETRVIQLVGRAGLVKAAPKLREIDAVQRLKEPSPSYPLSGRSALLALAQLGDQSAIRDVIASVDGIEDLEARALNLGQLSYIRQPEVAEYLRQFLFSDAVFEPKGRDVLAVSESERAAGALRVMLEGFPKGSIEEQRAWMRDRTNYRIKGRVSEVAPQSRTENDQDPGVAGED